MNRMTFWSVLASLFCSLAISDGAFQVSRNVQLAAVGNPDAVRALSAVVGRMAGQAQLAPAPAAAHTITQVSLPQTDSDLISLSAWTRKRGRTVTFEAPLADMLGLGRQDFAVMQRGYYSASTKIGYAFNYATFEGKDVWVMQKTIGDLTILWMFAPNGDVVKTVTCENNVQLVPFSQRYADFRETLAFILDHMRSEEPALAGGPANQSKS